MIPLLTTTPSRIRNPIMVLALKRLFPVKMSASSEPMAARGMENSNTKGVANDSNTDARIIKIRMMAAKIKKLNSSRSFSSWITSAAIPEGK